MIQTAWRAMLPCLLLPLPMIPWIFWYKTVKMFLFAMKNLSFHSSLQTWMIALLPKNQLGISQVQAITDTDMGDDKRTRKVPSDYIVNLSVNSKSSTDSQVLFELIPGSLIIHKRS